MLNVYITAMTNFEGQTDKIQMSLNDWYLSKREHSLVVYHCTIRKETARVKQLSFLILKG